MTADKVATMKHVQSWHPHRGTQHKNRFSFGAATAAAQAVTWVPRVYFGSITSEEVATSAPVLVSSITTVSFMGLAAARQKKT